jgi:ABC-type transport system involved in cytochrome c biogenesis permease component
MVSALDRLQKDAQASELDYTNTPEWKFLAFSAAQVAVVHLIGGAYSPKFQLMAWLALGAHWVGFVLSLLLGTNMHFDLTEGN